MDTVQIVVDSVLPSENDNALLDDQEVKRETTDRRPSNASSKSHPETVEPSLSQEAPPKPRFVYPNSDRPPQFGKFKGLFNCVYVYRYEDQRIALSHPDLERGYEDGHLPFIIPFVTKTLLRPQKDWFYASWEDGTEKKIEKIKHTISVVAPTGVKEVAKKVAEALRNRKMIEVHILIMDYIIQRFEPTFKTTPRDVFDFQILYYQFNPSVRWLSPYHIVSGHWARDRLIGRMNGNGEAYHHAFVSWSTAHFVVNHLTFRRFREKIEKTKETGFDLLHAFSYPGFLVMPVFRRAKVDTDLGGILPRKLLKGQFLVFDHVQAQYREQRFLNCVGQRIITELVAAIIEAYYPEANVVRPQLAPKKMEAFLTEALESQPMD